MGHLTAGLYYHMIGKTGNNIGRKSRGQNTISMLPHPSHKPVSLARRAAQGNMSIISSWFRNLSVIVKIGFHRHGPKQTAMNAAVSLNMERAIRGNYPELTIDYTRIVISNGGLSMPCNPGMENPAPATVSVSWSAALENTVGSLSDVALVLFYNESKSEGISSIHLGTRGAGGGTLRLPGDWRGDEVHGYLFMSSADRRMVSDTVYLGKLSLS